MRVRTRWVVAILLMMTLACTTAGCAKPAADSDTTTAEPVKVGAILSLTGTYAGLGASEKNALELEVKRINDAGGIAGRPIELVIEDDATDEAKAVAAAAKLIEQDEVVALIGATGTGQSMAIRGDVQRAGVAQVSMAGGTVITKEFDEHVFQTPWSNTIVVPAVLDRMKADGHTKVALISDTGGYGKDGKAVIEASVDAAGIELVANETFNPGDTDFTAQLTKAKSSGADSVLLWTAGKEGAVIVKQANDLGLTLPWYGGSGQARREFAEGAGDAAEGFVFVTGKSLVPSTWGEGTEQFAAVSDFAERYEAAYGESPDIFAGHAFDAISIVADALGRAPGADGAELRDAVEAVNGLVGFGGTFGFTATDHNGLTADDLAVYVISGGEWKPAE